MHILKTYNIITIATVIAIITMDDFARGEIQGPRFVLEPPSSLVFSNTSGGRADCVATGVPPPRIEWLKVIDLSPVTSVPGARIVLSNGSLLFPPFRGEAFRPDVHAATYKCSASNSAGKVNSLDVHVRAVVLQHYEAQVHDAAVIGGNNALLRCQIPSYVRDHVSVTSWLQDETFNIYPTMEGEWKHLMLPNGDLHIFKVVYEDASSRYRCRTLHRLTGQTQESVSAGRLLLREITSSVSPKITDLTKTVNGRRGEDVIIPCVAQGFPIPSYRWHRKLGSRMERIENPEIVGGSLILRGVQPHDSGIYVCVANSSAGSVSMEVELRIRRPLTAHVVPPSVQVDSGVAAEFTCVTSHDQVTWVKDGQTLETAGGPASKKLIVENVQRKDEGMYQCIVTREGEAAYATTELRLGASKPQLVYQFIEQTLQPGPDVSLKCIATGQPTPQLHWTLDGFALPRNERFVIGQYVSVIGDVISHVNISKVAIEDGGMYTCSAVNRIGQASHSAPLRIYGLPLIRKMDPISAVAGEMLVVTCPAAGFPIHSITWEKDGRVLPINLRQFVHSNGTLIVSNVQQRVDQGTYTCQARNRQGHSDKGSVEIAVMEPPSIYPFSVENGVQLGERVGLQCLVTKGDAPLTIQWLKDDTLVSDLKLPSLTVTSVGEFSSTLLIEELASIHGGRYTCQAKNPVATTTHSVQLNINVPPEIAPFIFPALAEGSRAQVACNVHRGDLPLNLTWLKDGISLTSLPGFIDIIRFDLYSSILKISSVGRADSGNYTCVASNPARIVTHTAVLSVSVPPEWVIEPKDASVIAGQPVTLQCQADGYPPPQHNWRKAKEKQSVQFGSVIHRNGSFIIPAAIEADEGSYLCEANNGIGAGLSAVITLSVNALPRFISPVLKETIYRGGVANLHCEAKGDTPMTLIWKRDGVPLPDYSMRYHSKETATDNSISSELTIKQAIPSDSGKYVCIATNAFGRDEIAISLYVQDAPEPPWDVHVIECKSREIKVAWSEPSDNNSPIQYYSVVHTLNTDSWPEFPKYGELNAWAVIGDLKPNKMYHMRVIAVNALGQSQPSTTVTALTGAEAPSGPPVDVIVSTVGPTSLQLSWSPPHSDERNGPILGYFVGIKQASESRFNFSTVQTDIPNVHPPPFVFSGLSSYTQYKLAVQAFNSIGPGPTSQEITATTDQTAPEEAPQDVECKPVSSSSLHLNWLPPPVGTHNGIIKGYKIFYQYLPPPHDYFYESELMTIETSDEKIVLANLEKYSNYSLQIAAFTSAAIGLQSPLLYCHTLQDVPEKPAGICAAISAPWSALISWLPPVRSNGEITRFYLYQREVQGGVQKEPNKRSLSPSTTQLSISQLREHTRYEWWVSAVTSVGEGLSSRIVTVTPSAKVPANIVTVGQNFIVPWKTQVFLHCQSVGMPKPSLSWLYNGHVIAENIGVLFNNGTLSLNKVQALHTGNYTCIVQNIHNTGSTTHSLVVMVPPVGPKLDVIGISWRNLSLSWIKPPDVIGLIEFSLAYRLIPQEEWTNVRLAKNVKYHSIEELPCGTEMEASLTIVSRVGKGNPGPLLRVHTLGNEPAAPPPHLAVTSLTHGLTIHLERWQDGDCQISHFIIEQRRESEEWTAVGESVQGGGTYTVSGLQPATFYHLRITAHNDAGTSESYFFVSTLTATGEVNEFTENNKPFYWELRVSLPIVASLTALILTLATVTICLHTKVWKTNSVVGAGESEKPVEGLKQEYYTALQKKVFHEDRESCEDIIPEYEDEVYPYATFQLSNPNRQHIVSSQRAFQTFVFQGSGLTGVECYADKPEYGHSDIEDYDSLGSDSDTRLDSFHHQHTNIRHSRLRSVMETSTSNENSPSPDHRFHQQKRGRFKMNSPRKKSLMVVRGERNSGITEDVTKETAFTFSSPSTRIKLCDELSEAECDHSSSFTSNIPLDYRI